jgi:hypothetical protein
MRSIATVQTDIQSKLRTGIADMHKWQTGKNEYFQHLEAVSLLPVAYENLLMEVVRRRAFHAAFESRVLRATKDFAAFRAVETSHRDHFMKNYGQHLPPVFFGIIPSLDDKPPFFTPSLTDRQWLPEVLPSDIGIDGSVNQSVCFWENQDKGRVQFKSPQDAAKLGISMVFQHFSLFENMSVLENIAVALPGSIRSRP